MVQCMWTYAVQHRINSVFEKDVQFEPELAHITAEHVEFIITQFPLNWMGTK